MQQYCGCYSLLLRYMPENVLFVTYSRSNSQPHTRLTCSSMENDPSNYFPQFTASYEADLSWLQHTQADIILQFTASYEADLFQAMYPDINRYFNSQPHARLTIKPVWVQRQKSPFNSQPHARLTKDLEVPLGIMALSIHSLMRGWPSSESQAPSAFHPFNSQPHARLTLLRRLWGSE